MMDLSRVDLYILLYVSSGNLSFNTPFNVVLQIDGDVYDVSHGSAYQPGGSYHILYGSLVRNKASLADC